MQASVKDVWLWLSKHISACGILTIHVHATFLQRAAGNHRLLCLRLDSTVIYRAPFTGLPRGLQKVSEHKLFQEFAGLDLQYKDWLLFLTEAP